MQPRDLLAKRQPEPGAALFPGAGFVHHVKGLCDVPDLFLRDSGAAVFHENSGGVPYKPDAGTGGAGLAGIVDEISNETKQQILVTFDFQVFLQFNL
jgi:hypothetical protein